MRLKEFIIFIIIFTIIYFLAFYIYDQISNKKALKNRENYIDSLIDLSKYLLFCEFYGITSTIDANKLSLVYLDLKGTQNNDLNELSNKYSLDVSELIVIIQFLEFIGIIKKRRIITAINTCVPLTESDQSLVLKYSLLFSNKYDYNTVISRMGFNSGKELTYMSEHYLMPGVILKDNNLSYVGDFDV